jgi:hypothetical protein
MKANRSLTLWVLVAMVLSSAALATAAEPAVRFDIDPWPDGIIPYRFDDGTLGPVAVDVNDQIKIERQMARWERAFTLTDPIGNTKKYFDFVRCDNHCPTSHLVIRYNHVDSNGIEIECNNWSDPLGMEFRGAHGHPDGITEMNLRRWWCPTLPRPAGRGPTVPTGARTNQDDNTILHELGHVLGVRHEFNRTDADGYLEEQPIDLDGDDFSDPKEFNTQPASVMPLLGNYDYDSLMAYAGECDLLGNPFSRQEAQDKTDATTNKDTHGDYLVDYSISPGLKSRLLQYYAYGYNNNWGFFRSLSAPSPPVGSADNTDVTQHRNPYLTGGVRCVGTPALAVQGEGNYDVFTRGSDEGLYWKHIPGSGTTPVWENLGCCFGSDPAAISLDEGEIDVFAVGSTSGKLIRKSYRNGRWDPAAYVQGGSPTGGIKPTADGGYLGPAVASRGPDMLDVFVVRTDGRLAVTTLGNGLWSAWRTLGSGYDVTARPAAVALSATQVQLAINETHFNLYEPLVTFGANVSFTLGAPKGATARQAPPALTKRADVANPYRVLITNADGRLSHRFAHGSWRDIGGMPQPGTGPSAAAAGGFDAYIVMNGVDLTGADATCDDPNAPHPHGAFIEPGGLWIRYFR